MISPKISTVILRELTASSIVQLTIQSCSHLGFDFDLESDSLLHRNSKVQSSSVKEAVVNCHTQDAKVLNTYYIF